MPTGLTAGIEKGITFQQFVWRCARGFGALISLRDAPFDAPIPDEIEIRSYHCDEADKARQEIMKYVNLSEKEAELLCENEYQNKRTNYELDINRKSNLRDRYNDMKCWVLKFNPPT